MGVVVRVFRLIGRRRTLTKFRMANLASGFAYPAAGAKGHRARDKNGEGDGLHGLGPLAMGEQSRPGQQSRGVENINERLGPAHVLACPCLSRVIGLRADTVAGLLDLEPGELDETADLVSSLPLVSHVARTPDGLLLILDLQGFLSAVGPLPSDVPELLAAPVSA